MLPKYNMGDSNQTVPITGTRTPQDRQQKVAKPPTLSRDAAYPDSVTGQISPNLHRIAEATVAASSCVARWQVRFENLDMLRALNVANETVLVFNLVHRIGRNLYTAGCDFSAYQC